MSHGYAAYAARGCRCDVCRQAKADYMRNRRAALRAGVAQYAVPVSTHGTTYASNERGCRCRDCRYNHADRLRAARTAGAR